MTYPQLLNQAIAQGLPEAQLARLRQAYDAAERMSAGSYRGQGVPFICHLVRTASIVLAERQPVEAVMAAMLHAAYLMRRFVEKLGGPLSERQRERLRRQAGADVERLVWEYDRQPWYSAKALDGHLSRVAEYPPITRQALVMHLANALEDYLDLGLVYRGTYPYRARIEAFGRQKIELARALGCDQLAQELETAFRAHLEADLPASLKQNRINTYVLRNGPGAFNRSVSNAAKRVKHALKARLKAPAECNGRMVHAAPLDYHAPQAFIELTAWETDPALREAVTRCLEIQRRAGGDARRLGFTPNPRAEHAVSEEALRAILEEGRRVSDITKDRSISNCIAFNLAAIRQSVMDRDVAAARRCVDRIVAQKVRALFRDGHRLTIKTSGQFWYPPGGFMGWHTNERSPGWRLYINYADEPGKSFIRYRDPASGAVVTKTDRQWNVRLFKISSVDPLWHAIYSQTNRFSLGYYITPQLSLAGRAKRALGKWRGGARTEHA
jgi:hypothetical protein